jgi:hypothetical protein
VAHRVFTVLAVIPNVQPSIRSISNHLTKGIIFCSTGTNFTSMFKCASQSQERLSCQSGIAPSPVMRQELLKYSRWNNAVTWVHQCRATEGQRAGPLGPWTAVVQPLQALEGPWRRPLSSPMTSIKLATCSSMCGASRLHGLFSDSGL